MAGGKLLVLGATSPTGQLVVKRALELEWQVTVYGRRTLPEHAANTQIKTIEGALDNKSGLHTAISGQDVIISVFGPSKPGAPTDVFVPAYQLILSTMKSAGVKRIIALSTYSVYDTRDKPNFLRWFLVTALWAMAHNVWKTIIGISKVFDEEGNDIDWTLFRVGFLANGPPMKAVDGYVGDGTVGMYLRRADIAEWTLSQAEKSPPQWVRQKPGISSIKHS
ncbi:putative NmrA family protein [Seiridium cardinale]|uniref:NmrA family protein n=1 Tax=Seiridium cardinale TaxID=138064 RepID=A0ABR2XMS0_9PEZI